MRKLSGSFSKEELLKDDPSKDALSRETLPKDLSLDELLPDETLLENFSFEFEDVFAEGTLPEDLSFENGFATEMVSQDLSSENSSARDKPSKDTSSQEDLATEKDPEFPDIGHDIKKSLRAMMQWCDDVANTPDNIITNFKSQLPFIIVLGVIILVLWVLRLIYG
jgi:hypothetical protein